VPKINISATSKGHATMALSPIWVISRLCRS
jgi:hypothetical protein